MRNDEKQTAEQKLEAAWEKHSDLGRDILRHRSEAERAEEKQVELATKIRCLMREVAEKHKEIERQLG